MGVLEVGGGNDEEYPGGNGWEESPSDPITLASIKGFDTDNSSIFIEDEDAMFDTVFDGGDLASEVSMFGEQLSTFFIEEGVGI